MAKLDWSEIQTAFYGTNNPSSFALSLESVKLLLSLLNSRAIYRGAWVVGGDVVPTDAEWDDIQEFVAGAIDALFSGNGGQGMTACVLEDQKTAGTDGGTFTTGAWRVRDLNTEIHDDIGVSLSSNEFTLPAGKYLVSARCPLYRVSRSRARLYNVSDSVVELEGNNEYGSAAVQASAKITGIIDISTVKTFRLEHRCQVTTATNGFGVNTNDGFSVPYEVYSTVTIMKI